MRPDDIRKAASLRSAGDQPRVSARRAQIRRWGVLTNRRIQQDAAMGGSPGSPEFPSSLVRVSRRTDLGVLASLPSSDLLGSGGRPAHPGLPQGERVSAAGVIAAAPLSSNPHSRGGGARHRCTRIAWLLQQGRVSCPTWPRRLTLHHTPKSPHPNRAILLYCSPPRGLLVTPRPPTAHGWGRFHQPELAGRTGWQSVCRVDAMHAMRIPRH